VRREVHDSRDAAVADSEVLGDRWQAISPPPFRAIYASASPRVSPLLPGVGDADQERPSSAAPMAGAAADLDGPLRVTTIGTIFSCSWNGSVVPRLRFVITSNTEKCTSDLQIC
jgi:hypothetical protein